MSREPAGCTATTSCPAACRRTRRDREVASAHVRRRHVDARLAAEDLARAFSDRPCDLTPEVMDALTRIEATLTPGQHEPELALAESTFRKLRSLLVHGRQPTLAAEPTLTVTADRRHAKPTQPSRRTRCATHLALRMLSPAHRQRYREEWAAELAALPRRDQAPYAFRLLSRAWSLRRELSGNPPKSPRSVLIVVGVVVPGADALAAVCGLDWPAAVVGVGWTMGLMWIVSSKDRTQHVATLIRAAANSRTSTEGKVAGPNKEGHHSPGQKGLPPTARL